MVPRQRSEGPVRRASLLKAECRAQPWDLKEFYVDGLAHPTDDPASRDVANSGTDFPRDDTFVLF